MTQLFCIPVEHAHITVKFAPDLPDSGALLVRMPDER